VDGPLGLATGSVAKGISVVNEGGHLLFCGKKIDLSTLFTAAGAFTKGEASAGFSIMDLLGDDLFKSKRE
jgi:hypothetical protein